MSEQPTDQVTEQVTDQPTDRPAPEPTADQQETMDGVEHAIDEAKKAEADLRAVDPGALEQPDDDPVPDARDSED